MRILICGASGFIGRELTRQLEADGHEVLSLVRRQPKSPNEINWAPSAHMLDSSVMDGVDAVINLSGASIGRLPWTRNYKKQILDSRVQATRTLVEAARRGPRLTAPLPHLLYQSIVGVDRIPLGYYRQKLASEQLVADSGLPLTILRATQFHDLVYSLFATQRRMPVVAAPGIRLQPIDVRDVAVQLLAVVRGGPSGRVADIGGPDVELATDLARATLASFRHPGAHTSVGSRRPIVPLRLPGRTFAGFAAGHNLVPTNRIGSLSYADYLGARAAERQLAEAAAADSDDANPSHEGG